jgi:hypothetical protein
MGDLLAPAHGAELTTLVSIGKKEPRSSILTVGKLYG